ncbi:zinc ribbon domain-containing protein [Halorussus halophilus]|uniref:zinc ribbon domain-containing protein n=1 Tax=Halorussus halophilus TaxID=2650975 RepID=UPI0013011D76|nr:zinc ribbon domain-containing protein [Halorussus halophilus]
MAGNKNSFEKELERIQNGEDTNENGPALHHKLDDNQKLAAGVIVGFLGFIVGALSSPETAGSSGVTIAAVGVIVTWMVVAETGVAFRRSISDDSDGAGSQQQQQVSIGGKNSKKGPKRVCGNCGWQNSVDNNYCHDCGEELTDGN